MELTAEEHAELVSRLGGLLKLAEGLSEAFDDLDSARGAREMLASIERMLAILGAHPPRD